MAEQFQNFFVTKLREACDATATTIYVDTVPAITEGTLVLEYANSTKHEIIHFTGVSGYGLTGCTRGLEGTTAQSHSAGTDVRQNLTAGMIDKIINGVITTENIANSAVTTAKINNGAVTADKIDFTTLTHYTERVGNVSISNCGSYNYKKVPGTEIEIDVVEGEEYIIFGNAVIMPTQANEVYLLLNANGSNISTASLNGNISGYTNLTKITRYVAGSTGRVTFSLYAGTGGSASTGVTVLGGASLLVVKCKSS